MSPTFVVLAHSSSAEAAVTLGLPVVIFAVFMIVQRRVRGGASAPDTRAPRDSSAPEEWSTDSPPDEPV